MKKYKLYKVTVEYDLVVAAPAEHSITQVERNADHVMRINADSIIASGSSFVVAEEIKSAGDLPDGWEPNCLPFSNYTAYREPEDLQDKTIAMLLEE